MSQLVAGSRTWFRSHLERKQLQISITSQKNWNLASYFRDKFTIRSKLFLLQEFKQKQAILFKEPAIPHFGKHDVNWLPVSDLQ